MRVCDNGDGDGVDGVDGGGVMTLDAADTENV